MNDLLIGLQSFLQLLPLGDWLALDPFGIVYGTMILDAFSIAVLLLSKLIYREYFSSAIRKKLFFVFAGGSAGLVILFNLFPYPVYYYFLARDMSITFIYYILIIIAYLFFIGYLVDFIIRLLRRGKKKKGGDMATE